MNLTGQSLGRYQLLEEIGRGGMAVVYKARHPTLERLVAVKVLAPHLTWDAEFVTRFQREANAAAQFHHPNIVIIHDVDEAAGQHFIVMQYLEAHTLEQIIRQEGPLHTARAAKIVTQVADALDYAHARGLVHRDVKPSNILVDATGHATLTDFGLAHSMQGTRLTKTGMVVGTPAYMAPEQVNGEPVSPATDVYALGIVTYEMLTGHAPFEGDTPVATLMAHVNKTPPPLRRLKPDVPTQVETVVLKALKKDPRKRYATAGDFATALQAASSAAKPVPLPGDTTPLSAPRMASGEPPPQRRVTVGVIAPVLAAVLAVMGIVILIEVLNLLGRDPRKKAATSLAVAIKTWEAAETQVAQGTIPRGTADAYATAAAKAATAATDTAIAAEKEETVKAGIALGTPRPTATPVPYHIALLEPKQGETVEGCVDFKWKAVGRPLPRGQVYRLFICRDETAGQPCTPRFSSKARVETTVQVDLDKPEEVSTNSDLAGQTNVIRWQVAVFGPSPELLRSPVQSFIWNGGCGVDVEPAIAAINAAIATMNAKAAMTASALPTLSLIVTSTATTGTGVTATLTDTPTPPLTATTTATTECLDEFTGSIVGGLGGSAVKMPVRLPTARDVVVKMQITGGPCMKPPALNLHAFLENGHIVTGSPSEGGCVHQVTIPSDTGEGQLSVTNYQPGVTTQFTLSADQKIFCRQPESGGSGGMELP